VHPGFLKPDYHKERVAGVENMVRRHYGVEPALQLLLHVCGMLQLQVADLELHRAHLLGRHGLQLHPGARNKLPKGIKDEQELNGQTLSQKRIPERLHCPASSVVLEHPIGQAALVLYYKVDQTK